MLNRIAMADYWFILIPFLCTHSYIKVNQSHYRPEVPGGFQKFKVPRLRDSGPGW